MAISLFESDSSKMISDVKYMAGVSYLLIQGLIIKYNNGTCIQSTNMDK